MSGVVAAAPSASPPGPALVARRRAVWRPRWWSFLAVGGLLAAWLGSSFDTLPATIGSYLTAIYLGRRWSHHPLSGGRVVRGVAIAGLLGVVVRGPVLIESTLTDILDVLGHVCWFMAMGLWTMTYRRGHPAMLVMVLVSSMCAMSIGGVSPLVGSQIVSGLLMIVFFAVFAQWVAGEGAARRRRTAVVGPTKTAEPHPATATGGGEDEAQPRRLWTVTLLIFTGALTWLIARGTAVVLPEVRETLRISVTQTISNVDPRLSIGLAQYVTGGSLGSIGNSMQNSPDTVALRIECPVVPGYLRGNAFTHYETALWRRPRRGGQFSYMRLPDTGVRLPRGYRVFRWDDGGSAAEVADGPADAPMQLPATGGEPIPMSITGVPEMGTRVFSPARARTVTAVSRRINADPMRIIEPGTIDIQNSYTFDALPGEANERLNDLDHYLRVPPSLRTLLIRYGRTVTTGDQSPRELAETIANHFQLNYQYSLPPEVDTSRIEPLRDFLIHQRPAHCEYFATATALLLRTFGVPTRYVTGYAVDEREDEEDRWIARNRDAHAWVEAYDRSRQTWFIVESTPGQLTRPLSPAAGGSADSTEEDSDRQNRGGSHPWMAKFRLWYSTFSLIRFVEESGPLLWALVAGLSALALWLRRRALSEGSAEQRLVRRRLAHLERKLSRLTGCRRHPAQTLHHYVDVVGRVPLKKTTATHRRDQYRQEMLALAAERYNRPATAINDGQTSRSI